MEKIAILAFNKWILIHFPFSKPFPPFLINYLYLATLFHFSWSSFFLTAISWFQEISWKVASLLKAVFSKAVETWYKEIWGAFHQAFCQCFSLTTVISYWNPCIWLAESKFVSETRWQNAWWNAPPPPPI